MNEVKTMNKWIIYAWIILSCIFGNILSAAEYIEPDTDAFLAELQKGVFYFFWNECGENGLIRDRMSDKTLSSTMAGGFQLTVYCIGAEHGWVSREDAATRVLKVLETYQALPRFHGMFAHYYDISTGEVVAYMHEEDNGADVSETGFMMAGALMCRQYFKQDNDTEQAIRTLATQLYEAVEWDWMLQDAEGKIHKTLAWHWSPDHGFKIGQRVKSNMELSSMITYLLAIGSPTHPIPADCWNEGWAANYTWWDKDGPRFIACPPLFAHQYSQAWIDFRNRRDLFADYFHNATYATRVNRDYCRKHLYPNQDVWGLTYCDGPEGYGIYGYPPKRGEIDRDAVTPPTAAAGSIVYTPEDSISTLMYIYDNLYEHMWGPYGLYDAFSLKHNWFFKDYVAIDEGPIAMMIENYRSDFIWKYFMQDDAVKQALDRAGFVGVIDDCEIHPFVEPYALWESSRGYTQKLVSEPVKEGTYSLQVSYNKTSKDAALVAHPAREDFSSWRYLSVWTKALKNLGLILADNREHKTTLPLVGKVIHDDGWQHLYYRLPQPGSDTFNLKKVTRVAFVAEPLQQRTNGTFYMDAIFLSNELDTKKPNRVIGLTAKPTRMPGEILLSWEPTGDDEKKGEPYQYRLKYARRLIRNKKSFDQALAVPPGPLGRIYGSQRHIYMNGLTPGETYYFAIEAEDNAGNISEPSKNISMELPKKKIPPEFMVDDFDRKIPGISWKSGHDALQAEIVTETALEGPRCLRITYNKKGEQDKWCYVEASLDFRDFSDYRYIMMWVAGQADVLVKVWNTPDLQEDIGTQTSSLRDGWSPLYFDLTTIKKVDNRFIVKLLIFPEPGKTDCEGAIWIDSIQLTKSRN